MSGYPPYAPYAVPQPPMSIDDVITLGHGIRVKHKSKRQAPAHVVPDAAPPRRPNAAEVGLSEPEYKRHSQCVRKYNTLHSDRLLRMSKPPRRQIINLWREYAHTLPPQAINRFRHDLGADEPRKPDEMYAWFRKNKKYEKKCKAQNKKIGKDLQGMCGGDRRYVWARKATVAFARGIQQRLSKPGKIQLEDKMVRLSNFILKNLSAQMKIHPPPRNTKHLRSKMVVEVADKVAVWIHEILAEADDRMIMMDYDEDEEVAGLYDGYADDFLDMMGGHGPGSGGGDGDSRGGGGGARLKGASRNAFKHLTDAMSQRGDESFIEYGKFKETYREGAQELERAPTLDAYDFNPAVANEIRQKLENVVETHQAPSPEIQSAMKPIINMAANYLAQVAEYNKDKGEGFRHIIDRLKQNPNDILIQKDHVTKTNTQAAKMLEQAKGLETDHDDPQLTQEINAKLTKISNDPSPPDRVKDDIPASANTAAKYLSQTVSDQAERGPAFDHLIKELEKRPQDVFMPEYGEVSTNRNAAHVLKTAPGLSTTSPDKALAEKFKAKLENSVGLSTPRSLETEMKDVINRCADYLAEFVDNRGKALNILLSTMHAKKPDQELVKRNEYTMTYGEAVKELETAPAIMAVMPVKDIANEIKDKLTKDVEKITPPEQKNAMPTLVKDAADMLSQEVAIKSGAAGPNYEAKLNVANEGPETAEQRKARVTVEKVLGRPETPAERQRRLETEKLLGRPETPEEMKKRLAEEQAAGIGGPETDEQQQARLAFEKVLGRAETLPERQRRLEAEKRLGRPETPEEVKKRLAEEQAAGIGIPPETDAQRQARAAAENFLGKPETPAELQRRLEAEKLLGRSETPEEMKKRIAEEQAAGISAAPETETQRESRLAAEQLGRPETPQERQRRLETEKRLGGPETPEETKKRLAAEQAAGISAGPETEQQRQARVAAENILGRPETPAERQMRLEAEKHLGRSETPEETKKRIAEEQAAGISAGPETEQQRQARIAAENILGRAETPQEHQARVAVENTLGRPETPAELKKRLEVEKRLGRPETTEEMKKRLAEEQALRIGGSETEEEKARTAAVEKLLGKPETPAEKARRLSIEKRLGRPETPEELQRRIDTEKRLGRPETPEELETRLADEKRAEQKAKKDIENILGRPETEDERLNRVAAEKLLGRTETPEEMRKRLKAEADQRLEDERLGITPEMRRRLNEEARKAQDPEHQAAMKILHKGLRGKGNEILCEQPQTGTTLTYQDASNWLANPPGHINKHVRNSGDTARLAGKLERKLSNLVATSTPEKLKDVMQDVVIESARNLSEYFVDKSYHRAVEDALIAEMQKREDDNLVGENGGGETCFFAAQRLKLADSLDIQTPNSDVAHKIENKLNEVSKTCAISRSMLPVSKEHVKKASEYLSGHVGKPNPRIEAYVRLLKEMEDVGDDQYLFEDNIKITYGDAAAYLRQLTSFKDKINRPNGEIYSDIDHQLSSLMKNVVSDKYTPSTMQSVISENSRLLTSYLADMQLKTEALKVLIETMNEVGGDNVLLRHGTVRKTFKEGAKTLRGKTANQLIVKEVDPVPCRKIEMKLLNLMEDETPIEFAKVMNHVIADVTKYLSNVLLHPQRVKVCKCMKNMYVQCELWCEEIGKRLSRPCCKCSRLLNKGAVEDLIEPGVRITVIPGTSTVLAPGVKVTVKNCPFLEHDVSHSTSCPVVPNLNCCPGLMPPISNRSATSYIYSVYETMLYKYQKPTRLSRKDSPLPKSSTSFKEVIKSRATTKLDMSLSETTSDNLMQEVGGQNIRKNIDTKSEIPVGSSLLQDVGLHNTQKLQASLSSSPAEQATIENDASYSLSSKGTFNFKNGPVGQALSVDVGLQHMPILQSSSPAQETTKENGTSCSLSLTGICSSGEGPVRNAMSRDVGLQNIQTLNSSSSYQKITKEIGVSCSLSVTKISYNVEEPVCNALSRDVGLQNIQTFNSSSSYQKITKEIGVSCYLSVTGISNNVEEPVCNALSRDAGLQNIQILADSQISYAQDKTTEKSKTFNSNPTRNYFPGQNLVYSVAVKNTKTLETSLSCSRAQQATKEDGVSCSLTPTEICFPERGIQTEKSVSSSLPAQKTAEESCISGSSSWSITEICSPRRDIDEDLSLSRIVSSSAETDEVTTEQMSDCHALLVSLMWNVQAWRGWLQENINRGLNYCYNAAPAQGDDITDEKDSWNNFQRKVIREALQWRQYNIFTRQLTLRLEMRYRDKEILSPHRKTKKTNEYLECQREVLNVISMFNHWTQWLMSIVKEADLIKPTGSTTIKSVSTHPERWRYFKRKIEQNHADWQKYKTHLQNTWERKYSSILKEWLPSWHEPGPVWVMSACGAVPSGAVVAGECNQELIFVARTMHRRTVYPAALLPVKHCCIVYAEGTTFYYTKYQVMCNAKVHWVKWHASEDLKSRAVHVATGTSDGLLYVGRVRYRGSDLLGAVRAPAHRCHVVISGRAFAFNCYDLLVLADDESINK